MIRPWTAPMLLLLALASPPTSAWAIYADVIECNTAVVPAEGYYLAIDTVTGFSIWLYQESNGVADLQREDGICWSDDGPWDPETGELLGDTIIF